MTRLLFALERYDTSGGAWLTAPPAGLTTDATRLVAAIHLPADEVVLALVEGHDAQSVTAAASAAGWTVDRVTQASWLVTPVTPEEDTACDA